MRVLHVLEALEGGTARHLVDIVRSVDGVEHLVAIPTRRRGVPTDTAAAGRLRAAGARVFLVEMHRSPLRPRNAIALAQVVSLIRRERPAVVHAHSSIGGVLGRAAAAMTRVPRVYTPNAIAPGGLALSVERRLGRITNRIIAVSASERDQIIASGVVPSERVTVIPNGIEMDPLPVEVPDLRRKLGLSPETQIVGTIARLNHQKAPERFVRVAGRLLEEDPHVHAVYIGDGPLRGEFAQSLAALPRDRFHHIPELPNASAAMEQFSVFALTSRFEGGPYTPLEAMRAGVPVVLTDVVGNHDAVIDGRTGFLVAEDDDIAFVESLRSLLRDPGRRVEMGEAARVWVRATFDLAVTAPLLRALYEQLIAARSSERSERSL